MCDEIQIKEKSNKRKRADYAKKLRCKTFICVLEKPSNPSNVGAVIKNIDVLGISKLYIVGGKNFKSKKNIKIIHNTSCGSSNYVYVHYFNNTNECINYLNIKKFISFVTSPHVKNKINYNLMNTDFTKYKKIAIWFGNESRGISEESLEKSFGCLNITMAGMGESLNLSNSTAIVLNHVANQRRNYKLNKIKIKCDNKMIENQILTEKLL